MKFDCIIMNPPYSRNLHLKLLEEAIKHLKDESSVVVNLSPVRWLQDPLAKYKEKCDLKSFEETIVNHIFSIEFLDKKITDNLFDIDTGNLGIYVCKKTQVNSISYFYNRLENSILDKTIAKITDKNIKSVNDAISYDDMSGICCVTSLQVYDNRHRETRMKFGWLSQPAEVLFYSDKKNDCSGKTYLEYKTETSWGNNKPKAENYNIKFKTSAERQNFYNIWKTKCLRYVFDKTVVDVHVHPKFMPFLGDAANPRTSLKGYLGEWTDDDLYKFFGITPEEQKTIEDTIAKYE